VTKLGIVEKFPLSVRAPIGTMQEIQSFVCFGNAYIWLSIQWMY